MAIVLSLSCVHCGEALSRSRAERGEKFCCRGCEGVHALLSERGWDQNFDSLREGRRSHPAEPSGALYEEWDSDVFQRDSVRTMADGTRELRIYLEGAHCAACVWLTEQVGTWVQGAHSVRLDLESGIAVARIGREGRFSEVAFELDRLGYRPHPVLLGVESEEEKRADRRELIRLGILGAGAGNLMLFSVPLYGGLEGALARVFLWISAVIFLPVFYWGATPFLKAAWGALRKREISMDLPIALGTTSASVVSALNLLRGSDRVYFDSIAGLLFLLVAARALLRRASRAALRRARGVRSLLPAFARRWDGGQRVSLDAVVPGDLLRVASGELLPVDGVVESEEVFVSSAWLTGETRAFKVGKGALIFAGSQVAEGSLALRVTQRGSDTRLAKLLDEVREQETSRPGFIGFSHRVGQAFTVVGLLGALAAIASGFFRGWDVALQSAISATLVACPCTFALAAPLVFSRTMALLAQRGWVVRRPEALERLAGVKSVLLDKTGTLTQGDLRVLSWTYEGTPGVHEAEVLAAVLSLESQSAHPIARALVRWIEEESTVRVVALPVLDFLELSGRGLQGTMAGVQWELTSDSDRSHGPASGVKVLRDGIVVARVSLGDRVRPHAKSMVAQLKALGLSVSILSGDGEGAVRSVGSELGIEVGSADFGLSPQEKKARVLASNPALFVGDGANDALALGVASVGVAFQSGMEASLRAADLASIQPRLQDLPTLIGLSRRLNSTLRHGFYFSLTYNVVALVAALAGKVSPLLAACLMPLVSLLTLGHAIFRTRFIADSREGVES